MIQLGELPDTIQQQNSQPDNVLPLVSESVTASCWVKHYFSFCCRVLLLMLYKNPVVKMILICNKILSTHKPTNVLPSEEKFILSPESRWRLCLVLYIWECGYNRHTHVDVWSNYGTVVFYLIVIVKLPVFTFCTTSLRFFTSILTQFLHNSVLVID